MRWMNSVKNGFLCGRGGALSAALFYLEAFLLSSMALAPLGAGLHRVLDGSPEALSLASGGGADLLGELAFNQPGLWAAGFGLLPWMILLHVIFALVLTAGTYGLAASDEPRHPWGDFWKGARRLTLPFAGVLALNVAGWGAVTVVPAMALMGVAKAVEGSTSPAAVWGLVAGWGSALFIMAALFKGSLGFGQARYTLSGKEEGFGRSLLKGTAFSLRRVVPAAGITLLFGAGRFLAFWGLYWVLAPGFATGGRALASTVLQQGAFLAAAYLRAAEIRAQVSYMRSWDEPAQRPAAGDPAPAPDPGALQPAPALESSDTLL